MTQTSYLRPRRPPRDGCVQRLGGPARATRNQEDRVRVLFHDAIEGLDQMHLTLLILLPASCQHDERIFFYSECLAHAAAPFRATTAEPRLVTPPIDHGDLTGRDEP